ncbi:MAG TPA: 6-phosphofructokinase [Chitinophagales bacterium]|nr:6-phosphofructokinase [Chitinophagales bacterium]HQO88538.1 6-phosphofructokinase [Chitinophagales bacterium]
MTDMKKIAVFTSGGDAPGMNACIRAVVRAGLQKGVEVYGIMNGYEGMIKGEFKKMDSRSVGNIIHRGGTILKSARSKAFMTPEGRAQAYAQLQQNGIDGVIAIGGDGTFKGAMKMTEEFGVPFVGLPGTIDNDLFGTDFTIGYDTAVQTAVEAIDKVRDTATSHGRLFFIEVMGRDVGFIALASGIAGGAEDIFIPETQTDLQVVSEKLKKSAHKESYIIVVSEGDDAGNVRDISDRFRQMHPEYDVKFLVLGHLLRGGSPTANDRILASRIGIAAVNALLNGQHNIMIGWQHNRLSVIPLQNAVKHHIEVNKELLEMLQILSY